MRKEFISTQRTFCPNCKGHPINCDCIRESCTFELHPNNQGKGLKLSWPRPNDGRRAVVSKAPLPALSPAVVDQISDARFVHTSQWDIELYYSLSNPGPVRPLSLLNDATIWNPSRLESSDQDLLEYFRFVACTSLATFGHDATVLGNILVRIALEGETASARAVLQALLAFSSLHRHGLQNQAIELKIAAIGSLAEGSVAPLGARETIEHIATGMLLCSFEVHQSSCTSGHWTGYLGRVKTVINTSSPETLLQLCSDAAVLIDWVHYHDVLARLSLLHWNRGGAPELPSTPAGLFSSQNSRLPPPIFSMLDLLSQLSDAISSTALPTETSSNIDDYKGFLNVMDWRIRSLPIPKPIDEDDVSTDETLILQLYQLAMLVYLDRISEGLTSRPARTQKHIDQAFAIFPQLSSCRQQFPILVIGCEARTDEQRAVVLDVIARTGNMNSSRSFNYTVNIVQAVWAQEDLAYGNGISYREKLTSVMNHCKIVPSFV